MKKLFFSLGIMADQTGMPEEVPIKLQCTDPEHYKNQMMTEDNPTFTSNEQVCLLIQ